MCHQPTVDMGADLKEDVLIAAVYWSNIDISDRVDINSNKIFYSTYDATYSGPETIKVKDFVRNTTNPSFTPSWTLVVTWYKVLPLQASAYKTSVQVIHVYILCSKIP